jgi:lipid-A-disaccharide synthase
MELRVLYSAGESSGDEHLCNLLQELRNISADISFRGMAGSKTEQAGFNPDLRLEKFASVMGFFDVLKKLSLINQALQWFEETIKNWKPDIIILVDYPDFNLKLAKIAKQYSVKTFYYIPPKLWAWRSGRIKLIKSCIDKMALIFPFEKKFYAELDYNKTVYVGHPFSQELKRDTSAEQEQSKRNSFLEINNLSLSATTLAVFPGSRKGEIDKHLPTLLETVSLLKQKKADLQVLLSVADSVTEYLDTYSEAFKELNIHCLSNQNLNILRFSDVGLIKSGTSNLQAAFYGLPFIMFYKSNYLTELIVKYVVKIKQYSLVNILESNSIEECVGLNFNSQKLSSSLLELIENQNARKQVVERLQYVCSKLSDYEDLEIFKEANSPAQRCAILIQNLINKKNSYLLNNDRQR